VGVREQAAPVDSADWYLELIELGDRLDPQTLTDALANAAYLSVVHLVRYQTGVELAERSLMVSDRGGVEQSPWSRKRIECSGSAGGSAS
jgi:hypothetical protein